jgi:thioredoxin 1
LLIIEFWASWCVPCQTLAPIIRDLEKEFKNNEKLSIEKINVDRLPILADQYKVKGVPTIVFIEDGKEFNRHVGSISKDKLREMIQDGLDR